MQPCAGARTSMVRFVGVSGVSGIAAVLTHISAGYSVVQPCGPPLSHRAGAGTHQAAQQDAARAPSAELM